MLVLACAVFLLIVMPVSLLWLGRMIDANTDGRRRSQAERFRSGAIPAAAEGQDSSSTAWYRRPMQPPFGKARRTT